MENSINRAKSAIYSSFYKFGETTVQIKKGLLNCSFQTKESLYITTIRLNEKNQAVQFSIE